MTQKPIRQQFADTMLSVGQENPDLVVVVGDIGHFSLQPFAKACPGRYYNIGICEPAMMSLGAGLSKSGLVPVIHTIAPFILERSLEQLKLDFGYHKLAGNIVTVGGAFDYSALGCTHHCYNDVALMSMIEGSQIFHPGTSQEFDALFRQAFRSPHLSMYRVPGKSHSVELPIETIKVGKGIKVAEGSDLTLVVAGPQLDNVMQARKALTQSGRSVEVIYVPTIRPLDKELLYAGVSKTKNVLVVEEHFERGGLGTEVLECVKDVSGLKHRCLGIPNKYVRCYGTYEEICDSLGLNAAGIVRKVEAEFRKSR